MGGAGLARSTGPDFFWRVMSHAIGPPRPGLRRRADMSPETLHRKVAEFEAAYGYDASYQHEMIDAAPQSAAIFATIPMLVDRTAAPAAALTAAASASVFAEDCQPCAQVGLDMARQGGV